MLFPKNKKRYLFSTITLCFSSLLAQSHIALAQMRLGRGIESGLEGHLIEYQLQQQPLSEMRSIDGCSVGIGVGCNKTASLLQKIVTEHSGKTYHDILLQAVGGGENYSRFTSYYSRNVDSRSVAIDTIPLNSFWIDGGDYVLDSYRYSGLDNLNDNLNKVAPSGFNRVVDRFSYAPIANGSDNLTLRQGLIGLKTAYGRTLIEEASKIPDIQQRIAAANLNPVEANFHLQQFINSVEAIESGERQQLDSSLYRLLSNPYTSEPGVLNRPSMEISDFDRVGIGLEGDEYIASVISGDSTETAIFSSPEVFVSSAEGGIGSTGNTPFYVVAGLGGLTVLALILTSLDGGSDSDFVSVAPANSNTSNEDNDVDEADGRGGNDADNTDSPSGEDNSDDMGESGDHPFPSEDDIPNPDVVNPSIVIEEPPEDVTQVPETHNAIQFLLLLPFALLFLKKKSIKEL